jgi:DNA primase
MKTMDAVEDIKARLSIEDVIGEYVQLKRSGRNWRGLSPFTNEKTPSFMVSPEKQIWHDFSSGKGGNMFSFVMEMEGLDFRGALEQLARKAGIDLEQYQTSSRNLNSGKQKQRVYELLELAAKFYQVQFSNNRTVLEYVLKYRKYSKATALEWQLGYSPESGSALITFLRSRKFTDDEMKMAGVSIGRSGRISDMFRGRLMIPLADPQGRIIGFTARILSNDPKQPKYINTPRTIVYDKSRHIFGMHRAKEAIRQSHYAVVVEGNLDVIASHQAGIRQTVAVAGTALTEQHLKGLVHFTEDIRLCFDADKAGIAATERVIPIASKVGVNLSMITLPSGKDPDELVKNDPAAWVKTIEKPTYALDWLIARYQQSLNLTTAIGKRQFSNIIMDVVRNLGDQVEQEHYVGLIATMIGVSREALLSKLTPTPTQRLKSRHSQTPELADKTDVELKKVQDHFLSLMLLQPKLRDYLTVITMAMLPDDSARILFNFLKANSDFAGDPLAQPPLQQIADYVKILMLQHEALYQNLDILELRYEAARLQTRLVGYYVKAKKHQLAFQMQSANEANTTSLLEQARKLDILLKKVREV